MKKQLLTKTLLMAVMLLGGRSALAQVIYSWEGGTPSATETGGTIAATDGSSNDTSKDDVNMSNSTYKVVRLRGAADFSTYKVTITLDNTLAAGDEIWVTGYRNKNSKSPTAGVKMKFNVGEATVGSSTGLEYVNIDTSDASAEDSHRGTTPNICLFSVPASAVGSNTITMTRSHTGTNFFITKIQVVRPTVNANIDFSNDITGTNPYTISGAVSSMTWTNQWSVTPYISDGRLCFGNFTGSVALQNQNIRPKDIVTISFEMAFGKNSGKRVGFQFKNTSGTAFLTQYFDAYNGDFDDNNPLNLDWAYMYRGSNEPLTDRCVYFTIILNYLTGSITTSTKCYMSGTGKAATFHEFTSSFTTSNVLGSFELYGNINTSGRNSTFDNLKISTIEGDYNTTSTITYSYQDQNSNDITDLVLAKGGTEYDTPEKGEEYTPVYVSSFVDDEYAYDYTYTSGGDAFTVTGDATITLVYTKTAHPTTDVTIQYKSGGVVKKEEVVAEGYPVGKPLSYGVHQYLMGNDGVFYQTSTGSNWYYRTANAAATIAENVAASGINNVVYFTEAEAVSGATSQDMTSRASNGKVGYTTNSDTYVNVTTLAPGKYRIYMRTVTANSGVRTFNFKVGEDNVFSHNLDGSNTNNTQNSDEFTVSSSSTLSFAAPGGGGSGNGLDWFYVVKTGEIATIGSYGYTTFSSSYPLALGSMTASTGTATAYYATTINPSSVSLTSIDSNVEEGEGLILKGTAGATITIPVAASGSAITNYLVGCPTATTITSETSGYENFYVLVNGATEAEFQNIDTWVTGGNSVTIPAGKAYLNAAATNARALSIVFGDDEVTGLHNLNVNENLNNEVYDLQGRRVINAQKGLYIVNGKKVVIK